MRADGVTGPIARAVMRCIEFHLARAPKSYFARVPVGATWFTWVEGEHRFVGVRIDAIQADRDVKGRQA